MFAVRARVDWVVMVMWAAQVEVICVVAVREGVRRERVVLMCGESETT